MANEITPEQLRDHITEAVSEAAAGTMDEKTLAVLKDQMLLALVNRLGGYVELPMQEIDLTPKYDLHLSMAGGNFALKAIRK